jgi:hypothetical protein
MQTGSRLEVDWKQTGSRLEEEIPGIGIIFEIFSIISNSLNIYVLESLSKNLNFSKFTLKRLQSCAKKYRKMLCM